MTPPRFERLVIFGVGLLGGSLGLAARRRGIASHVVGLGRSQERLERARQLGALDECQTRPQAALAGADALVLAVPPRQIREKIPELAPLVEPGAFVTDVGSVKRGIVEVGQVAFGSSVGFVGSHPMAGSEKTGVVHARSDFYEGCACVVTPTEHTPEPALKLALRLWRALGARMVIATPERHDQLLAGISHLPHVVASALMQTLGRGWATPRQVGAMAGGGLIDTTRIAGADPEMWRQILSENGPAVRACLDRYMDILKEWREALDRPTPDARALGTLFGEGAAVRCSLALPEHESGE